MQLYYNYNVYEHYINPRSQVSFREYIIDTSCSPILTTCFHFRPHSLRQNTNSFLNINVSDINCRIIILTLESHPYPFMFSVKLFRSG